MEQENSLILRIPEGTTVITKEMIPDKKITGVIIPDTVTRIEDSAFAGCSMLKSVSIPDSVTSIGEYAFCGCEKLESVTLSRGLTRMEKMAFLWCSNIQCIRIPDGVTYIGPDAFGMNNLKETVIPASVTFIGDAAFETETYPMGNMQVVTDVVVDRGSYAERYFRAHYSYAARLIKYND